MTSKNISNNVEVLKGLIRGAKEDVRGKVIKVVEWYKDRKISQRETAVNLINGLMGENKRTSNATKKKYDKKYEDIEGRKPLNERMAMNRDNYFTSCDPHHDIYTCSYWHIFWHSI